ncbi:MAG: hypothetical protein KGJ03_12950 [Betaproteobacteria bacterium]|nr:hypothetical protein [Betaproteobacteria bacterium]
MAAFAIPLIESAVAALGGWLLRAAAVIAGAGVAQMASTKKDDTRARTSVQELTRGDRPRKDCPPRAGWRAPTKHSMTRAARFYQWRVTGWPYDEVKWKWSEEWQWRGKDFDGFVSDPCLIQEAKGDYDKFLVMEWSKKSFKGFDPMRREIEKRGAIAKAHPPTRVKYYFQGRMTLEAMRKTLLKGGVEFVHYP